MDFGYEMVYALVFAAVEQRAMDEKSTVVWDNTKFKTGALAEDEYALDFVNGFIFLYDADGKIGTFDPGGYAGDTYEQIAENLAADIVDNYME